MSSKALLLRGAKVFALGCFLPSVLAGTALLVWAIWATNSAAESLAAKPDAEPVAQGAGGWIEIPGFFSVPRESVAAAIPPIELVTRVARTVFGERSPQVGRELGFLAQLYGALGDFDHAEELYNQSFAILNAQPAGSADLGWLSNNLGMTRLRQGEVSEATELFERALAALPPARHPRERSIALQNLATAATEQSDWERADAAYLEALTLLEKIGQEGTRPYFFARQNYAVLRLTMGDNERAREIFEGLLSQSGQLDSTLRLALLNNLGEALRNLKQYEEAEKRFRQAAALAGRGSVAEAQVVRNLAVLHFEQGDLEQARREAEQAVLSLEKLAGARADDLVPPISTLAMVALAESDIARAEELLLRAEALWKAHGPADHPMVSSLQTGLAVIALQRGDASRAKKLAMDALALDKQHLRRILSFGSEAQRLAYRQQTFPYDLLANLGEPRLLAETVLEVKGIVSESLLTERMLARRSTRPEDRERLARIRSRKRQILAEIAAGDTDSSARRREQAERALEAEEGALARSLGKPVASRLFDVDLARVQAALAPGEALIEMVRFERLAGRVQLVPFYGAIILPATGESRWVLLGSGAAIDAQVAELGQCLWRQSRGVEINEIKRGCEDPQVFLAALTRLHRQLWKPLADALPEGTERVVLSPDGALHFVPWAALPDEQGRFLAERFGIAQVTSGRDLLREPGRTYPQTILALGRNGAGLALPEAETQFIAEVAAEHAWRTKVLNGELATELALFHEPSPGILHLATHGYFLRGSVSRDEVKEAGPQTLPKGFARVPMLRGYVELAHAERSVAAWSKGEVPAPEDDGILTAEEAASLDLAQTWLTVLSACETGLGEAHGGEGVMGLRHGFRLAGSQHLLLSLWRIDDAETLAFMEHFYQRLFAVSDPVRAFVETQRAELVRVKSEKSILEAVLAAGGFVLTR